MTHKIPLLIDTDPGVDDALALLMAFADERHDVVALTIAAGNVGLDYTVRNALKLCDIVGRTDVPVFAGSPDPLLHPSVDAAHVHGRDGYGDVDLPPPSRQAEAEHAALAILRHRNRDLPQLELSTSAQEQQEKVRRTDQRVREFLVREDIITIPEFVGELGSNTP